MDFAPGSIRRPCYLLRSRKSETGVARRLAHPPLLVTMALRYGECRRSAVLQDLLPPVIPHTVIEA